ncbi:MAG: multiubiquitin domain-containing protein [Puia sp.]|nr:multiubiquitin domain-containing protein [Puia sp.]
MRQYHHNQEGGGAIPHIPFYVENQLFKSAEQYRTGLEIKKIAGLSSEVQLLLAVTPPYEDEEIHNDTSVNLARTEIEHFYVKKKLPYSINGTTFESHSQYIQGKRIRRNGNIPETQDIFLAVQAPFEPELIEDDTFIDLAIPGKNDFFSRSIDYLLIINAKDHHWHKKTITYAEVVKIPYPQYTEKENEIYTVTYKKGPIQNPQGQMVSGDKVFVKNKMLFHVTPTDKS